MPAHAASTTSKLWRRCFADCTQSVRSDSAGRAHYRRRHRVGTDRPDGRTAAPRWPTTNRYSLPGLGYTCRPVAGAWLEAAGLGVPTRNSKCSRRDARTSRPATAWPSTRLAPTGRTGSGLWSTAARFPACRACHLCRILQKWAAQLRLNSPEVGKSMKRKALCAWRAGWQSRGWASQGRRPVGRSITQRSAWGPKAGHA